MCKCEGQVVKYFFTFVTVDVGEMAGGICVWGSRHLGSRTQGCLIPWVSAAYFQV